MLLIKLILIERKTCVRLTLINLGWVKGGFTLIWSFCNILYTRYRGRKRVERQDGGYLEKRRRQIWQGIKTRRLQKGFIDYR